MQLFDSQLSKANPGGPIILKFWWVSMGSTAGFRCFVGCVSTRSSPPQATDLATALKDSSVLRYIISPRPQSSEVATLNKH